MLSLSFPLFSSKHHLISSLEAEHLPCSCESSGLRYQCKTGRSHCFNKANTRMIRHPTWIALCRSCFPSNCHCPKRYHRRKVVHGNVSPPNLRVPDSKGYPSTRFFYGSTTSPRTLPPQWLPEPKVVYTQNPKGSEGSEGKWEGRFMVQFTIYIVLVFKDQDILGDKELMRGCMDSTIPEN